MHERGLAGSIMAFVQPAIVQTGFIVIPNFVLLLTRGEFRNRYMDFQRTLAGCARVFRDIARRVTGYMVRFSLINLTVGVGAAARWL